MDEAREPLTTCDQLASMIDHSLLRPELTEKQVIDGCQVARDYGVANVTVRPSDVDLAVGLMQGSPIPVASVTGFPHGSQTTPAKLYEARDLLRRGVKEVDMVINIGKLISRQFQYLEIELMQMAETCHNEGAILKVIFENAYLANDLKVVACKLCKRTGVDFAKTSTGFAPTGSTLEDLRLMVNSCSPRVRVKAAGGIRTLEQALAAHEAGCTRIGVSATVEILEAWKRRLEEQPRVDAAST